MIYKYLSLIHHRMHTVFNHAIVSSVNAKTIFIRICEIIWSFQTTLKIRLYGLLPTPV